ncbi:hypothetical protein EI94DRAFT_1772866 [Lactarius quietus]|nr:hypothetical protein EI94DRAFT_1772866 [Lactarius quietus]
MRPHVLEMVCSVIDEEMDCVAKREILPGISAITLEFIKSWTVGTTRKQAPFLTEILLRAAHTPQAKENNKKKHPEAMCTVIVKQLPYQHAACALGFPVRFGLFLWSSGCSWQTINALHQCGLPLSYQSVLNNIKALVDHCMHLATQVSARMHVFCYDNVQISMSIFVEQCGSSGPAKVTSGTFGILYKVRNGNPEHMPLAPIMEHFWNVEGLEFNHDICPTRTQREFYQFQFKVVIIRVLLKYCPNFKPYEKDPTLQNIPRHPMPSGYVTKQFPLHATTIEEATVHGNLLYHDDVYLTQLQGTPEVFQLGFGLFHLCLNLQAGSLAYFFVLLEKTCLGGDHPNYHTLLSALTQVLDGILLNAWRYESGFQNLSEFTATTPPNVRLATQEDLQTQHQVYRLSHYQTQTWTGHIKTFAYYVVISSMWLNVMRRLCALLDLSMKTQW